MENIRKFLDGKKAYLLCAGMIIAAAVGFAAGELTALQAISAVWAALYGVAQRAAITKSGVPPTTP